MSDIIHAREYQDAVAEIKPKRSIWLVILDYVFYVVLGVAVIAFLYYVYQFMFNYPVTPARLYISFLLGGTVATVVISVISLVLATIFGLIGALGRLSRFAPLRWITAIYVEVVRGTPLLVQILLWYFSIGQVLGSIGFDPYNIAYQIMTVLQNNSILPTPGVFDAFFYGIIGLSFNYGAYLTEVFRTGIETVDKGQAEAALSLGLTSRQTMRHIVLPQAIRITIPPFTNYFITLIQDSALLSTISVGELAQHTSAIADPLTHGDIKLFIYVLGGIFYFVLCYSLTLVARFLERRFARAY
jgi:His/Glu/Gln/Arg/opine family amino acid ABC transporter permease subunit